MAPGAAPLDDDAGLSHGGLTLRRGECDGFALLVLLAGPAWGLVIRLADKIGLRSHRGGVVDRDL